MLSNRGRCRPNSDFYELAETLNAEELSLVKQVRAFTESKVAPVINKYWAEDAFPFELQPALKELNIGGLGLVELPRNRQMTHLPGERNHLNLLARPKASKE